jgi:hypothetical protein
VNSRERISNKNPAGLKTDSVHSKHSSNRPRDPRSSTASSTGTERSKFHKDTSTPTCRDRDRDWYSVKFSIKGLWKSVIRIGV